MNLFGLILVLVRLVLRVRCRAGLDHGEEVHRLVKNSPFINHGIGHKSNQANTSNHNARMHHVVVFNNLCDLS